MPPKYPCVFCEKSVRNNQNAMLCVLCKKWGHLKCSSDSESFFKSSADWICNKCLSVSLPFADLSNSLNLFQDSQSDSSDSSCNEPINTGVYYDNKVQNKMDHLKSLKGIKIAHLNCLSLLKHFDE